eukprot:229602_1
MSAEPDSFLDKPSDINFSAKYSQLSHTNDEKQIHQKNDDKYDTASISIPQAITWRNNEDKASHIYRGSAVRIWLADQIFTNTNSLQKARRFGNNPDAININFQFPVSAIKMPRICSANISQCSYLTELHEAAIIINFSDANITNILDSFHHLLFEHQNDFEHIYNELIDKYNDKKDCLLANCLLIRRNQCQSSEQWNNLYYNTNVKHITIQQIMDTIHCHFFHSFDIGYQFTQKEKNNIPQKTDEKEEKDNDTSDKIVKYIHGKMQQKRKLCQGIKGLERITDSQKFRSDYKCGIKYFYWDYYKDKEVLNDPAVIHDRSKGRDYLIRHVNEGHKNKKKYMLKDWYIQSMFQNLKQELLKNKICTISPIQWNSLLEKATKHIQTNFAKTLKCAGPHRKEIYGIVLGQPITAEHIIAMMVYCNYDTLQKRFSTTFRRVDEHMEDNEIKQAHQNYAHLGRLLREFTDCFGTSV